MSTHNLRKYLDLLNEAESRTTLVANQPVIPGQPLSPLQMATVDFGRQMGNQPRPEVQAAYDMAKKAGVTPGSGAGSATDLVPPNAEVALPSSGTFTNDQALAAALAQEDRCAKCGTPKAQHAGLKHAFAAETAAPGGGGGGIARIKQLQQELKAAGAALGATGAGRDGIDGALGPLTRAAAAKYPAIAAKYSDVLGAEAATPAASQATISQLNTALDTIEQILAKYKVKMSESRSAAKPDQMASWRNLMENHAIQEAVPTAAQRAAYYTAIGQDPQPKPSTYTPVTPTASAETPEQKRIRLQKIAQQEIDRTAKPVAAAAEKVAGKGLLKGMGKTAAKAIPGVGLAIGAVDAYDRAKKGDYTGAGIAATAGLVSLLPGLGWAAGLGLDAVNLARDAVNDPKINISPEDAAVLDQNLKTLQDLSKDPAVAAAITPEIRTRLERVIKAAASVIVADTPAAGGQSATPAGTAAAPDDLVKSVDGIEKILTKYKFEDIALDNNVDIMTESELRSFVFKNMHLLSESEQMAVRRDMINEIVGTAAAAALAYKYGKSIAAKAAKATPAVAKAGEEAATTASKAGKYAWNTAKTGLGLATAYGAYTVGRWTQMASDLNNSLEQLSTKDDGSYLSDADKAELEQHAAVLEKYLKTPEDAAKLPPEIQQRLAAINTRMKKLVAAGVDR